METKRQEKISKLIQKDLGLSCSRRAWKWAIPMITVTKVNVTSDLSLARVYVSLFATDDKKETLALIKSHGKEIRFELGKRVKNQLRKVPDLQFFLDDSLDHIERIDELLDDE
ncbi:MAG: 30S ribosome-binding factor RbfA [Bacteroidales bacterium]|nr:30S ribosome-binding factor RbfA [Bacteroidales bacterium]